ncbi:MAG: hypothetical protein KGL15_00165 [Acidobacteriota bacterium]|nr:hypothetical protein [Acidobacteriota bacterium]
MSAVQAAPVAIFADLEGDLWGIVTGGPQPRVAVARLTGADVELRAAELELRAAELELRAAEPELRAAEPELSPDADLNRADLDLERVWTVTAAGCALRIGRAAPDSATDGAEAALEPCRVSGSATIDGAELELDVGGVRAPALSGDGWESLRLFAAWFGGGHELAVLSSRPKGAKGHDRDSLAAVARGEEQPLVVDPRLSTTYDTAGVPLRVGLELWLGADADGELAPRRVAGLATGSRVARDGLSAHAFECVSRGEPGAGIYLLLRA